MSHDDLARRVQQFAQGHRDQLTPDDLLALGWAAGAISKVPVHPDADDLVPRSARHTKVVNEIGDRIIRVRTEANEIVENDDPVATTLVKLYTQALNDIGQMVGILSSMPLSEEEDFLILLRPEGEDLPE